VAVNLNKHCCVITERV